MILPIALKKNTHTEVLPLSVSKLSGALLINSATINQNLSLYFNDCVPQILSIADHRYC